MPIVLLALLALTISAFAIGTTEFVIAALMAQSGSLDQRDSLPECTADPVEQLAH
ncbi:hypothetical protein SAMN02745746_04044 [Pseudogulbenkiania subflava DSM 22618]|uniref:Uncharacterized protein n=1 Tax=Pseudogulbenkiania subflava DSM 22618 TaxID=1123014 RepID=A0A1Y6CEM4_9NEIS|nr:hypothetical protein SAMN02745746_04044 [Pseudogulbenkiania subflava DSM 22618]